ncbi:MAG: EAL domain-containing protein [Pseudomonadota bacterium]
MSQPNAVKVLVVGTAEDDAENVNKTLRGEGIIARCEWFRDADLLGKRLSDETHLVIVRHDPTASPSADSITRIAQKAEPPVPVLWLSDTIDESLMTSALQAGAEDVVSLQHSTRFSLTVKRTIEHGELKRQMMHSRNDAATIQKQISTLIDNVPDAIAHVQEGIIVEVNKAWLTLFGFKDETDCIALPLMDAVSRNSQSALKGALKAVSLDRWPGEPLNVDALKQDGEAISVPLILDATHYDGEPAVRVSVKPPQQEDKRVSSLLRDAARKDAVTYLYHRTHFLKVLKKRLESPLEQGVRTLAWIRIDNFKAIRAELGVLLSEEVIADFAEVLRQRIDKSDIAGRFEGTTFTLLMERGNEQDALNWANAFAHLVSEHTFRAGERTIDLTCSIGICPNNELIKSVEELLRTAEQTYDLARKANGSGVAIHQTNDEDTRIRNHDALWSRRLTEALKDNRFRLLQQPIAALDGEVASMFDILVRLIDEQDQPIAPSEFFPAARRTNMLHAIDRWVIGASMSLCRERRPDLIFARLSEQSLVDKSFPAWLKTMVSRAQINPAALCFQVTEETALNYLTATAQLASFVRSMGCRFALEHCGVSDKADKLVAKLPLDFVKIDGGLIANLAADEDVQKRTTVLVDTAKARSIQTIAERVQDANTMAALWQLGISFMQGHYVQEPEVILQDTA